MENINKITSLIDEFFELVHRLQIDIHNDGEWPFVATKLISGLSLDEQLSFWLGLADSIIAKEKQIGHCHKGDIYWRIAITWLLKGDVHKAIESLELSKTEDDMRSKDFTASKGMLSILDPMFNRIKAGTVKKDLKVVKLYESLTQSEKEEFGSAIVTAHDISASNSAYVIDDKSFGFTLEESRREVVRITYQEVVSDVLVPVNATFYSDIFSIGSILEAMIDDLFERNDQRLWLVFKSSEKVQGDLQDGRLSTNKGYPSDTTLAQKVMALRLLDKHDLCPMPKLTLLQMVIISKYRDLIHPARRLNFQHIVNIYVTKTLLRFLASIAHFMWPVNYDKSFETVEM